MFWNFFVYFVVLPGVILAAMLCTASKLPMDIASIALSTPIKCGSFTISLATFFTSWGIIFSLLAYSALRRDELRMEAVAGKPLPMLEYQMRNNRYYHERNLWISLFGLTIWAAAWRLKRLIDLKQFVPQSGASKKRGRFSRALWALGALLALVIADIPLCRINYNMQLANSVTPKKVELLAEAGPCENAMFSSAVDKCATFCQETRKLSEERSGCVQFARDWHLLGRVAAEIFDDTRGVQQGMSRIDDLFTRKSCAKVLRSVDKANWMVNVFCYILALISIIMFVMALTNVFDGSDGEANNLHKD